MGLGECGEGQLFSAASPVAKRKLIFYYIDVIF